MAKRILVIDDDENIQDMLQVILAAKGYLVDIAYDGRQAISKLKQNRPDLLITDLTMPVMDGWALLIALKRDPSYASLPVLVITSSQEMQHVEKAKKMGVESYIVKPFEPEKVLRIVRHLIESPDPNEKGFSGLMEGDLLQKDGL